ncbi:MAG: tetratricopeptide repeat protein [Elusimicrobia bacterium]|nr:tetratricopeptide repeat protein [Elusimicrobiota bacterium]
MKKINCLIALTAFFAVACAPVTTQTDITQLRSEFAALQVRFNELQRNQADLFARNDSALVTIDSLEVRIQDVTRRTATLNQNIQDIETQIRNKALDPSVIATEGIPSEMYRAAYSDFVAGRFELAISGFENFLAMHPRSDLAPQAQFFLAESFFAQRNFERALTEYRQVARLHPTARDVIVAANLKIALSYEALGNQDAAMAMFGAIVRDFPQSAEALTARERIRRHQNVQNR